MAAARVAARFAALRAQGRAGLIAYVMAGDPEPTASAAILAGLPGAGADLIELGFPFSDPMAEGPPIQKASRRALEAGTNLARVLGMVAAFRDRDRDTPVVLMGYLNPLLAMGLGRFAAAAAEAGVDGLIVVDCPFEEEAPLTAALRAHDLALIRLVAPTTGPERMTSIAARAEGFVYFVSVAGVTGVKSARARAIADQVGRLRALGGVPVAVGFGVRTPAQAGEIARIADAVVVGSALVDAIAEAAAQEIDPVAGVAEVVRGLAGAVRMARAA
ncbi:MAG TPA: tryptophan synthase subunit alpha [Caulobacteraceae bacterium]|nr:tryptophan synthase subunit alpha [Caulobacteraceae bacterium]